jgi:hypothetical protein
LLNSNSKKVAPLNLDNYMLPCWSKTLFGVECLGCGLQRAFLLLLKGDFVGAFQMYPAIYVTLVFFGLIGLNFVDKSRNYQKYIIIMAVLTGFFMLGGYLYKNY